MGLLHLIVGLAGLGAPGIEAVAGRHGGGDLVVDDVAAIPLQYGVVFVLGNAGQHVVAADVVAVVDLLVFKGNRAVLAGGEGRFTRQPVAHHLAVFGLKAVGQGEVVGLRGDDVALHSPHGVIVITGIVRRCSPALVPALLLVGRGGRALHGAGDLGGGIDIDEYLIARLMEQGVGILVRHHSGRAGPGIVCHLFIVYGQCHPLRGQLVGLLRVIVRVFKGLFGGLVSDLKVTHLRGVGGDAVVDQHIGLLAGLQAVLRGFDLFEYENMGIIELIFHARLGDGHLQPVRVFAVPVLQYVQRYAYFDLVLLPLGLLGGVGGEGVVRAEGEGVPFGLGLVLGPHPVPVLQLRAADQGDADIRVQYGHTAAGLSHGIGDVEHKDPPIRQGDGERLVGLEGQKARQQPVGHHVALCDGGHVQQRRV